MLRFSIWMKGLEGLSELRDGRAMLRNLLRKEKYQELFVSDFCKKMVKEVDKSDIISHNLIISPVLGAIPPERLSGGVSMLLSIYFLSHKGINFYFESMFMGDNCAKYLMEIAEQYDVNMLMVTSLDVPFVPNQIYSLDEDRFVTSKEDFMSTYFKQHGEFITKWNEDNYDPEEEAEDREFTEKQVTDLLGY